MDAVPVTFPCTAYHRDGFQIPVASPEEFEALPSVYSLSPFGPWPTPPSFPCTVRYFDGFTVRVTSQEEFEALLPGYSFFPYGPWPDVDMRQVPWKPGFGPFAPYPLVSRLVVFVEKELVVARRPLVFKYAHVEGEIFRLDDQLTRKAWLKAGHIEPIEERSHITYRGTTRFFVHETYRDAYEGMYTNRDIAVFMSPDVPILGEPAREHGRGGKSSTGGNKLSRRELDRFQKHMKETVWEYMDKRQDEDSPQMIRIQHNFPENLTPAKWRTRYERTQEEWGCNTWHDIILHIMKTRT